MIRELSVLVLVVLLALAARFPIVKMPVWLGDEGTLTLGILLIVGFVFGRFTRKVGLPGITGYLLAGLLFGPWVVTRVSGGTALCSMSSVENLRFFDDMALGLIAFTAGGEMKIAAFKGQLKNVGAVTLFQVVVAGLGVGGIFFLGSEWFGFPGLSTSSALALALILGIAATAKSPATTIAVINEFKASGPMTRMILGVTVLKDVVVIGLFAGALATAKVLLEPSRGLDLHFLGLLLFEVVGSLVVGGVLGWLMGKYIESVGRELPLLVLGLAFTSVFLATKFHLSGLLICLTGGFVIENFSPHGESLIKAVERYSLPVYVIFFAIAGASLDLSALLAMWSAAIVFVVARGGFTMVGTWIALSVAGVKEPWRNWAWLGFIGQAGVTLGFAAMVEPLGDWGCRIRTLLLAAVALNQIIGPVVFKVALDVAGETGKAEEAPLDPVHGETGMFEEL